jgi:AIPR protein
VRVQGGNEIFLRDYQIVNGCQTSNLLFDRYDELSDDVTVMLKIVETSDREIVDEVVRSTNRQTKVQDAQFLATLDSVRAIERYFAARGADEDHRLFFERRKHQFAREDVAAIRVFGIPEVARCAGAMFFDKPNLAARYPNRLTGELSQIVYASDNREEIYYTACYAWYRMQLHFGNKRLDPRYRKLVWHILCLIKYTLLNGTTAQVTSPKIAAQCSKVDKFMADGTESTLRSLKDILQVFGPIDSITRDRLKGQTLLHEARAALVSMGSDRP